MKRIVTEAARVEEPRSLLRYTNVGNVQTSPPLERYADRGLIDRHPVKCPKCGRMVAFLHQLSPTTTRGMATIRRKVGHKVRELAAEVSLYLHHCFEMGGPSSSLSPRGDFQTLRLGAFAKDHARVARAACRSTASHRRSSHAI